MHLILVIFSAINTTIIITALVTGALGSTIFNKNNANKIIIRINKDLNSGSFFKTKQTNIITIATCIPLIARMCDIPACLNVFDILSHPWSLVPKNNALASVFCSPLRCTRSFCWIDSLTRSIFGIFFGVFLMLLFVV